MLGYIAFSALPDCRFSSFPLPLQSGAKPQSYSVLRRPYRSNKCTTLYSHIVTRPQVPCPSSQISVKSVDFTPVYVLPLMQRIPEFCVIAINLSSSCNEESKAIQLSYSIVPLETIGWTRSRWWSLWGRGWAEP